MTAKQHQIVSVDESFIHRDPIWLIEIQHEGVEGLHLHALPKCSVGWRAVEYGLDHTTEDGRAEIMDLLIHEPYMPQIDINTVARNANGIRRKTDEIHLFNAPSRSHAWDAHRGRLLHTKTNIAEVAWPKPTRRGLLAAPARHPWLAEMIAHKPTDQELEEMDRMISVHRENLGLPPR